MITITATTTMKKLISRFTILFFLIVMTNTLIAQKTNVDLIVKNARIYTVNESFDIVEAMAVDHGKFVAVGADDEIMSSFTSDNIVDAHEKFVYPGFNDGHSHFLGYGIMKSKYANLVGTGSLDEVVERTVVHNNKYPGAWILGRGWDQNDWADISFPTKDKLDKAFPNNPVVLTRIDGHAVLINSKALKLANIDSSTEVD